MFQRLAILFILFNLLPLSLWAISAEQIVVVANESDSDSLAIAEYYMEKRGIPKENLIKLRTSKHETIEWETFVETIFNPLRTELYRKGWIEGSLSDTLDDEGRLKFVTLGGRMDFMVVCRIPLRIKHDEARLKAASNVPAQKQFQVNSAAVDSELSLLAVSGTPTLGFIPNPLYGQLRPSAISLQQIVRVARLDGPTVKAVQQNIDAGIEVEAKGLRGRAYIDLGGPHPKGDDWIEMAGNKLESMHFPTSWNRGAAAFGFKERFDAPALYFGWWKSNVTGPIAEQDFSFAPGAIGWHLHSYSANSVRKKNYRWVGPLVQRGLVATVGNVYEPYLELTHHPHVFVDALVSGMTVGEAAYCSLPALSWMGIFVGDPLYSPFKVDLEAQIQALDEDSKNSLNQYVILREIEKIRKDGGTEAALNYGKRAYHKSPGIALAYALSGLSKEQDETNQAKSFLLFLASLPSGFSANEQGLIYNCAELLWELGARKEAFGVMHSLMESNLPVEARKAYLPQAILWARSLNEQDLLVTWSQELQNLEMQDAKK